MSMIYMRFPDGKSKALTLSYDDCVIQDKRLVSIMDRYGIKGTFNINSGLYYNGDTTLTHRRLSREEAIALYKNSVHEVAVHTYTHPWIADVPSHMIAYEVIEDRKHLEADFECVVRGMAYPMGSYSDLTVDILKSCDILYSRTTVSTENFNMPKDWLRLPATCHHNNPRLMELADKFLSLNLKAHPKMFYLWGHSYEFDNDNNWNVIEDFCEKVSGKEDIWYATNIEIYEYEQAYKRLVWSVEMTRVTNPSAIPVWFNINKANLPSQTVMVAPGETVTF